MRFRSNVIRIVVSWAVLLLIILTSVFLYLFKIRETVGEFAVSNAKTALQNDANRAVLSVLSQEEISYSDISHVSRNSDNEITGIEIDAKNTNILKSKILLEINGSIPQQEIYTVKIPLGTLISNNIFGGLGPAVPFNSQISSGCNVDFRSKFESVGVNETRHCIYLDVEFSGIILILGKQRSYSANTTFLIAETIISGHTPQTYARAE